MLLLYTWDSSLLHEYKLQLSAPDTLNIFEQARNVLNSNYPSAADIDLGLNNRGNPELL